jgi:hypothetical protein
MNKLTPSLLVLLGISIGGNLLAIARLSRSESALKPRVAVESRSRDADRPVPADPILGSGVDSDRPPGATLVPAAALATAPGAPPVSRASAMLADIEAWTALLAKLKTLAQVEDEFGGEHYQELAWEATAEHLGIEPASLTSATRRMWEEADRAEKECANGLALLPPPKGEPGWGPAEQTRWDELRAKRDAAVAQSMEHVRRLLSPATSRRHQRFAARIETWSAIVRSPETGVRFGW